MRTNKVLILMGIQLLWMSVYIGGCERTCKQQYNDLNYIYGGTVHSMNELWAANAVSDEVYLVFADKAAKANEARLAVREIVVHDQCQSGAWKLWMQKFRERLLDVAALEERARVRDESDPEHD